MTRSDRLRKMTDEINTEEETTEATTTTEETTEITETTVTTAVATKATTAKNLRFMSKRILLMAREITTDVKTVLGRQ